MESGFTGFVCCVVSYTNTSFIFLDFMQIFRYLIYVFFYLFRVFIWFVDGWRWDDEGTQCTNIFYSRYWDRSTTSISCMYKRNRLHSQTNIITVIKWIVLNTYTLWLPEFIAFTRTLACSGLLGLFSISELELHSVGFLSLMSLIYRVLV